MVGGRQGDKLLQGHATGVHPFGVQQRHAQLDAGHAIGHVFERGLFAFGQLARLVVAVGRMVGAEHLKRAVQQTGPHRFLRGGVARGWAAAKHRAFQARAVNVFCGEEQILRAGLGKNARPQGLGMADVAHRFDARHMHDQHRHIEQARQRNHPVGGFALGQRVVRYRMELGRHMAVVEQPLGDPFDDVVVFSMHHHQSAFAPGGVQHIEHLPVIELELVVGGVDLERGVALADQVGQVVLQGLGRGVRDDQVKAVVDHRFGAGTGVVIAHHFGERHAPMLCGKRDDGGVAPKSGSHRGRVKVVGGHHPVARYLLHMAMAVDAAGQHPMAAGVDVLAARGQAGCQGVDEAVAHTDVGAHAPIGIHHSAISDGQVKFCQNKPLRCKWKKRSLWVKRQRHSQASCSMHPLFA